MESNVTQERYMITISIISGSISLWHLIKDGLEDRDALREGCQQLSFRLL